MKIASTLETFRRSSASNAGHNWRRCLCNACAGERYDFYTSLMRDAMRDRDHERIEREEEAK